MKSCAVPHKDSDLVLRRHAERNMKNSKGALLGTHCHILQMLWFVSDASFWRVCVYSGAVKRRKDGRMILTTFCMIGRKSLNTHGVSAHWLERGAFYTFVVTGLVHYVI